ncbi:uncharacterized protein LOC123864789 isoform X2 [Maniola jurtina]|uniref:uncharacterized protein LOC123864789 isoform X2 n=1 Tax=Maniola jurtina TaxID=191418 RepID=UPI001E68B46D|nr:uncharacterized protein LOC123864789 isoform X2 [Maniola jurtina]
MGLREKVTLTFLVLVTLQMTVNCLRLPQKYTPRARTNGAIRKFSLKCNPLQPTQNLENYRCPTQKYGESIRKKFNFPETEYSGISICFPNQHYQEPSIQNLAYKSHNAFSTYKNNVKKSINSNTKNMQRAPIPFPECSSAPIYRDICNFPDVEYPLCASEIWKPYYWNGYLNNNLFYTDTKINLNEEKSFRNYKVENICGFNKGSEMVTMIDKNLNATLEPKQSLSINSYNINATNTKKCENSLQNEDKSFIVLSRVEDCSSKLLPTEDRENEFGSNDEDYTTDDPEYQESSFYAQSTVAPPISANNDKTWENTKVLQNFVQNMNEFSDYFISV